MFGKLSHPSKRQRKRTDIPGNTKRVAKEEETSRKKRKTVSQEIAELASSRVRSVNPDEQEGYAEDGSGAQLAVLDAFELGLADEQGPAAPSQLRRQVGMELEELSTRYGGTVRRHAPREREDEEEEAWDEEEGDEEEGDEEEGDEEEGEGEDGDGWDIGGDSDQGSEQEEEADEEREDVAELRRLAALDRERLEADFLRMEQEQRAKAFQIAAQHPPEENQMPQHVYNQNSLQSRLLTCRIALQKPLSSCSRLPRPAALQPAALASSCPQHAAQLNQAQRKLVRRARTLLQGVLTLQDTLSQRLHSGGAPSAGFPPALPRLALATKPKKGQSLEQHTRAYWQHIESCHLTLQPWLEQSITLWNRKAQEASGQVALQAKQFKAINQDIMVQVENTLADKERLLKRTQLRRAPEPPVALPDHASAGQDQAEEKREDEDEDEDEEGRAVGRKAGQAGSGNQYDPEIYDDTDFFQTMLQHIISTGDRLADDQDDALLQKVSAARKKGRKQVDRRASKGRQICYTVQPKLEHFMAPVLRHDQDFLADELFAGLFGQQQRATQR